MNSPYVVNIISFTKTFFRILFSCLAMAWKLGRPLLKLALLLFAAADHSAQRAKMHAFMYDMDSCVSRKLRRRYR